MSGIYHEWNGTVLTITSDSGTSSADLKGATGDDGCRGPQGPAGESASVSIELDTTLTKQGLPAEAKAVGDRLTALEENSGGDVVFPVESVNGKTGAVVLTAEDVGAVDTETHADDISGLETQINSVRNMASSAGSTASTALTTANSKQNAVFYSATQPADWVNGDIWLQPAN